jgi:hypothetical protein
MARLITGAQGPAGIEGSADPLRRPVRLATSYGRGTFDGPAAAGSSNSSWISQCLADDREKVPAKLHDLGL